jgi:hypothetical protein
MICRSAPVLAHSLMMFPVFGGISGSNKATLSIRSSGFGALG